jgi:hypothetical protein
MSRFFVGQRVRIKWSDGWPELAGREGRISERASGVPDVRGIIGDWRVAPDAWGTHVAPTPSTMGGRNFAPSSDQLEPILPDGHRACDEDFKRDLDKMLEGLPA